MEVCNHIYNFEINRLPWTLKDVDRGNENLEMDGKECLGVTYYHDLTIYMDSSVRKELYRQTLIHELIHAFSFSFGVHLRANEKTEESVCDFMGSHFDEITEIFNMIITRVERKEGR